MKRERERERERKKEREKAGIPLRNNALKT